MNPTDKPSQAFQPRRTDRDMPDRRDQLAVIASQQILTLALCQGNQPYLVTLDYAFDPAANCFYVHTALAGKKLTCLRANPRVWGQVLDDLGYVMGRLTHAYRCVMFEAVAEFVENADEKRQALAMLIDAFETVTAEARDKMLGQGCVDQTTVLRLRVLGMSGKQNRPT
jgi:nitroimidazol reductase NimA-like FMN-containing flavoprotein (pyridoxamine 5'-phosphate oxidase superfamily)